VLKHRLQYFPLFLLFVDTLCESDGGLDVPLWPERAQIEAHAYASRVSGVAPPLAQLVSLLRKARNHDANPGFIKRARVEHGCDAISEIVSGWKLDSGELRLLLDQFLSDLFGMTELFAVVEESVVRCPDLL
jgi:hypothetical protein